MKLYELRKGEKIKVKAFNEQDEPYDQTIMASIAHSFDLLLFS